MTWQIVETKSVLKNAFFEVIEDRCEKQDGNIVESYYTVKKSDAVVVAAFTKEREIILIEQYRHPVKSTDVELPAGYIEENEDKLAAAKRELLEETGYQTDKVIELQSAFTYAGLMNNTVHFFAAFNCEKIQEPNLDPNEEISTKVLSWTDALAEMDSGKIKDMASILGIMLAKDYLTNSEEYA